MADLENHTITFENVEGGVGYFTLTNTQGTTEFKLGKGQHIQVPINPMAVNIKRAIAGEELSILVSVLASLYDTALKNAHKSAVSAIEKGGEYIPEAGMTYYEIWQGYESHRYSIEQMIMKIGLGEDIKFRHEEVITIPDPAEGELDPNYKDAALKKLLKIED